jgi:hypothetical protein
MTKKICIIQSHTFHLNFIIWYICSENSLYVQCDIFSAVSFVMIYLQ